MQLRPGHAELLNSGNPLKEFQQRIDLIKSTFKKIAYVAVWRMDWSQTRMEAAVDKAIIWEWDYMDSKPSSATFQLCDHVWVT